MNRARQLSGGVERIAASSSDGYADDALRRRVHWEQVRNLYAVTQYTYRTSIIFAVLVFLNFYTRVPNRLLLGWFLAVSTVAVARLLLSRRFAQVDPPDSSLPRWSYALMLLMILQGLGWIAVLGIASYTGQVADAAFAVFLLCALSFGGFAALGFFLPAYLAFCVPLFAALGVWVFTLAPAADVLWLALTVGFGSLAILDAAVNSSRVMREALMLGYEREGLVRRLTEEKERAQVTLRSIADGVLTTDTDGVVTYLNPVAERITGWRNEEAVGRQLEEVLHLIDESSGERAPDPVRLCMDRAGLVVLEDDTAVVDRSGERESAVQVRVSPIRSYDRKLMGVVVVIHDVTELRGMARVMSYQANHDPLTGLVNRREFEARLWHALESARAERLEHALAYIDVDQFKLVNDTCGHLAGDQLLKQLADLMAPYIRDTDTLARLGGDEFGLLLYGCSLDKAQRIAEDICAAAREFRFAWDDKAFTVGVSIGLAPVDGDGTLSDVLAAADAACFAAKEDGRGRVHVVRRQGRQLGERHGQMQWTPRVQRALDQDLFRLRFQKILPLEGETMVLAEILLGMQGADGRLVPPGQFLPAAERFNMMPAIDREVVRKVFERVAADDRRLAGIDRVAINLSGQSLSDDAFLNYVLAQLAATGANPQRICFEITETAVIANLARAKRFIHALLDRGCSFSLDDFGSGLSSFGYLRTLPVDYLKIDGLFVRHMSVDPIDYSMVEAINHVGHVMGIKTIAEFVESPATLESVRLLGVDYAQGYDLHPPESLE